MQKILIVNNGLAGGGIERASTSMANQFAKLGYDVFIVALYKSEHFFKLNNEIHFIEPDKSSKSRLYVLWMIHFLRNQVKKIKPDTILAFGEWTNPFVCLALNGLNYPIFLSDRMSPLLNLTFIHRILKKIFYPRVNGIIAQTHFSKKIISERTGANNIIVIPNPVNIINKIDCERHNIIVTVGRLSKEKGHDILIKAFSLIKDKTWKLSIVGDGVEMESLKQLVKDLNIADRVIFNGYKKDFSAQLSEAKIFVLPSLSEGFPNAIIEAMSLPMACIATQCTPAMEEVVKDGVNAILVEPGNAGALSEAIDKLISDVPLQEQMAHNAYKIRDTLSFDKIAQQYLKFILNV